MSAQSHARKAFADGTAVPELVDELAAWYPRMLVTDQRARMLWISPTWVSACTDDAWEDLRRGIPSMPKPEESFAVLSELRANGFLLGTTMELLDPEGRPEPGQVSIFPLASEDGTRLNVIIAHRCEDSPGSFASHPLLDSAPDPLLATDPEGFLLYANAAAGRMLGVPPTALLGAPVAALVNDGDGLPPLLRALRSDEPGTVELMLRRVGNEPLAVAASVSRHACEGGGAVLSLRDVSAGQAEAAELMRRNAELEHCVNALAHDLRSPLVALLGFSRLLRQDYGDRLDDTGAHFIDRMEQAGRTMEGLIHDLLELSRIGQPGERPTLVDPRAVILQLAAELKPRLDADGIRLVFPETPPMVYCDRTRLYQVLSNLIGNAADHMGECEDRRIVVDVDEQSRGHRISVRDFGRGIPEEHHDRIFEVFQSVGRHGERGRSTGMGLAIVRKIAETHDGRAWVESSPGRGATFHVLLPRP